MPSRRIFKTASFQLTLLFGVIFAVSFLALFFITYWTVTAALSNQMKAEVHAQLQVLAEEAASDGIDTITQDIVERTALSGSNAGYFYLVDAQGRKLAGNIDIPERHIGLQEAGLHTPEALAAPSADDDDHQIWGEGIRLADGSYLFAGQDAFRLLTAQEAIIGSFAWSASIAFLLAMIAGVLASRGFLRRIDAINVASLAIIGGRLKERISVHGTSDEIDRLSANLNRLFDSNQALLESLKQVSASIAHELRTPLSRLRHGLEESRSKSGTVKTYKAVIDAAIRDVDETLAIFAALLRIAQIESGSRKAAFKTIDLTHVFERVVQAYGAVAEDGGKELAADLEHGISFFGDAELILQMLVNLVENAIRHTPPGTRIVLSCRRLDGGIIAGVADSGPGIAADQRHKVFEHFYRLEGSRTTQGSGLGLALVSAIARLHGVTIQLTDNAPGLKVALAFPQTS